jgi:glycosyltransferase involved in cell wall biosynthesis
MKFSVLLPTRNRLELMSYAIESVRRQDYENWELIVSDNDSQENIEGYIASLKESRIHYTRTAQFISVTENWNNALDRARGEYVIMLGDDDCLLPGYFTKMLRVIQDFDRPDLIYTDACLFGYPGVLPDFPAGFLRSHYNSYFSDKSPHRLDRATARDILAHSVSFVMAVNFNMQLSLFSRELVEKVADRGAFFQSPFPDYYATNVLFLKSDCAVIYQQPVVVIGVSPKSYGFYQFNRRQDEGAAFLNNLDDALFDSLLPGDYALNCWLLAMYLLEQNYTAEFEALGLKIDYRRYRDWRISQAYKDFYTHHRITSADLQALKEKLTDEELNSYNRRIVLYKGLGVLKQILPRAIYDGLRGLAGRRTVFEGSQWQTSDYKTILDVYAQFERSHE